MRLPYLCTSALLLSPVLFAQHPTEIEPNDTAATATPLSFGTQTEATMVAAEQDWYSFTIASPQRVQIHTSGLDTRIALYDASGTTLQGMDEDGRRTVGHARNRYPTPRTVSM